MIVEKYLINDESEFDDFKEYLTEERDSNFVPAAEQAPESYPACAVVDISFHDERDLAEVFFAYPDDFDKEEESDKGVRKYLFRSYEDYRSWLEKETGRDDMMISTADEPDPARYPAVAIGRFGYTSEGKAYTNVYFVYRDDFEEEG